MARIIKADIAQVEAAQAMVERAARGIGEASPEVRAIANAKRVREDIYAPDAYEAVLEDDDLAS